MHKVKGFDAATNNSRFTQDLYAAKAAKVVIPVEEVAQLKQGSNL